MMSPSLERFEILSGGSSFKQGRSSKPNSKPQTLALGVNDRRQGRENKKMPRGEQLTNLTLIIEGEFIACKAQTHREGIFLTKNHEFCRIFGICGLLGSFKYPAQTEASTVRL